MWLAGFKDVGFYVEIKSRIRRQKEVPLPLREGLGEGWAVRIIVNRFYFPSTRLFTGTSSTPSPSASAVHFSNT